MTNTVTTDERQFVSLDDVVSTGYANGANPFQIADAVKAWRSDQVEYGKATAAPTNPAGYWNGTARMDADINDVLTGLRMGEINNRVNALGYTNPDDKQNFLERLDSADGNPNSTALSDQPAPSGATEKLVAADIQKLAKHPAFTLDTNLSHGNTIDVGGNTLARFSLRDSGKGKVDALVNFDRPDLQREIEDLAAARDQQPQGVGKETIDSINKAIADKQAEIQKSVQVVTLKDVDLPARIKEQEAKIAEAEKRVANAETMAKGAEKMAAQSEAGVGAVIGASEESKYAAQDLQNQQAILAGLKSPGGRTFALNLDLQEELKKPEYEAKMGDKNLWGDFVSGAKQAIISSGIAVERAREVVGIDGGNMGALRQGLNDLQTSDPGSTQRAFQGGLLNQTVQGATNSLGSMAMTVLPTGALSRAVTGSMEKMFATSLVEGAGFTETQAAARASGAFGKLGEAASASAMGPMSYGSEYARMLDQADSLQKTDPELAAKIRSKADIAALMQASIDFGTELIGEGHNPFLQRAGFATYLRHAPGNIVKEGLEEVAAGGLERGIKQPITQDGTPQANQPVTQGMLGEFTTGAAAAGPLIASGAPFTGSAPPGTSNAGRAPQGTPAPGGATARAAAAAASAASQPAGETNTVPPPPGAPTPESFSKPPPVEPAPDGIIVAPAPEQVAQAEKDSAILHDSAAHGLLLLGGVGPQASEEKITSNALALNSASKESADSLAAQIDMMVDPAKPKTAVFIDEGTPAVQEPVMAAVEAAKVKHGVEGDFGLVKVDGGMVLFDKAAHPDEAMVVQMANSGTLGQALGYGVASKPDIVSEENRAKLIAEEAAGLKGTELQQKALSALTILLQSPGAVEKAAVVTDGTPEEVKKVKEALQKLASPTDKIVEVPAAQMPDVIAQREQHKADLEAALKRKQGAQEQKRARPRETTAFTENPTIFELINSHGGLMSRSNAQRGGMSKEEFAKNKSEWDDAPQLAHPTHNVIYSPKGQLPSTMATVMGFPDVQSMWAAIKSASNTALQIAERERGVKQEEKDLVASEKQFAADVLTPSDTKVGYYPGDGEVNDTFKVDGETVTVKDISDDGYVTLQSDKWGTHKITLDQQVFTDKPTGKASADFLPAEETPPAKDEVPTQLLEKIAEIARGKESDFSSVDELAASMKKEGQKEPVTITYDPKSGRALLSDGNHRLAAAIKAGIKNLRIEINRQFAKYPPGRYEKAQQIAEPGTELKTPEQMLAALEKTFSKQTDMFAGTKEDPFNLIAETPEERAARQAEEDRVRKNEEKRAAAEAKAAAEKNQISLPLEEDADTPFAAPSQPLTPATSPPAPIVPIKPLSEIIRDLAKGFDIPIRFGRLTTRNFSGYFKAVANLIASKKANDIPTVAHEVGHKLDELFKFRKNPALRTELEKLGDPATPGSMSSWTKSKTLDYKLGEGVGEFVRHYLTDPAKALADARQTSVYFNGILNANPDFGDVMRQAQADIQNWRNAPFEARLDSSISIGSNPNKTRYGLAQLTRDLVDDLHIIRLAVDDAEKIKGKLKPSENPYLLARLLRGSYGMADTFLRHGTIDFNSRKVTPGTSLEHALKPVAGRIDAFRRWIVAKRAKELHTLGKETGLDRNDVDLTVAKYDADPVFQKAFADIKAWNDALLQYAVDAGYVNQEGADAMRAMHQDYVPMHRVFEIGAGESASQEGAGAGRGLNVGTVGSFRRLGGSTRDIVDPLETMVRNAYSIITASEKTAINKAIGDLSTKHGMGGWVEKIATPKEALKAPLEKIRQQLEDAGADLTKVSDDLILQFFRDSGKAPYGENIIRVTHAGTTTFYRLKSELFDTFAALDKEESGKLITILSSPAQLLRAGVTLDPSFGAANLIRDAFGSAVINRYRLFPFEAGLKGAVAMVGSPGLVAQWAASGADNSMEVNFFDREATANFLREKITKQLTPAERALIFVKGPLSALRWMSAKTEEATRIGEYKTALEHHLSEGMAPGEARRLAAFEARDRQDFAKGGAKTKDLRRMAAFWNAGLQANVAIYHAFKERPIRSTMQGLMYITLPTLALLVQNWDDKDYWDRPQWERDVFWLVPFGKDANGHTRFLRIPKPFILGLMFGALPERLYAWSKKNDPKAFDGFAKQIATEVVPNPSPQVATLLVGDLLTGKRGWDFFRGREVVPESLADLPASLQWTEQTSLTARKIGALLDFPPVKIDHIIAGTTGGLGRQLVHQAIDRAIESTTGEKRTASNVEPGGRFFATPAGINSKAVEDFYSTLADLREKKAGAKHLDETPKPAHQTKRAKQKAAENLGAENDYDYKHLQLMERASRDISDVRDKIGGTDDPVEKQKLYLQIKDIAEKAMGDTYKPPVAKLRRKTSGIGF